MPIFGSDTDPRELIYRTTLAYGRDTSLCLGIAPTLSGISDMSDEERKAVIESRQKFFKDCAALVRLSCRDALKNELDPAPKVDDLLQRDFNTQPETLFDSFFEELFKEPRNPGFAAEVAPARAFLTSTCLKIISHCRYSDRFSISIALALRQLSFEKLIEVFNNLFVIQSRSTIYRSISIMKAGTEAFLNAAMHERFCLISWDNLDFGVTWGQFGMASNILHSITIIYFNTSTYRCFENRAPDTYQRFHCCVSYIPRNSFAKSGTSKGNSTIGEV